MPIRIQRKGYWQTEVGVIPVDWKVTTASQVCELVVDCKNRSPPVTDGGDYAVVRTPNVRNGRFVRDELRFTDEKSFREWTARAYSLEMASNPIGVWMANKPFQSKSPGGEGR